MVEPKIFTGEIFCQTQLYPCTAGEINFIFANTVKITIIFSMQSLTQEKSFPLVKISSLIIHLNFHVFIDNIRIIL